MTQTSQAQVGAEEAEVQMKFAHTLPLKAGKHVNCVLTKVTSQLHSPSSFWLKEIRQEASRAIVLSAVLPPHQELIPT